MGLGLGVGVAVGEGVGVGVGVALQGASAEPVLRGEGVVVWKSGLLSSVSVQPSTCLRAEAVFEGEGAGPVPSKQFALVP